MIFFRTASDSDLIDLTSTNSNLTTGPQHCVCAVAPFWSILMDLSDNSVTFSVAQSSMFLLPFL